MRPIYKRLLVRPKGGAVIVRPALSAAASRSATYWSKIV